MNYDLVFYVYSQGILDFEGMPNLVMINIEEEDYEIVPEKQLISLSKIKSSSQEFMKFKKSGTRKVFWETLSPSLMN